MVQLRGLLWRKLKEMEKKEEKRDKKKEVEEAEEIPEEELKEKEELLRKEEERLRKEKIKMLKALDEINKKKLKEMGLDIAKKRIRCILCKKWEAYNDEELLELIKKNDFDVIWKYICKECRKKLKKEEIPEEYSPEILEEI